VTRTAKEVEYAVLLKKLVKKLLVSCRALTIREKVKSQVNKIRMIYDQLVPIVSTGI
jgi:hypothetical protein